jgi:hypothetical protein
MKKPLPSRMVVVLALGLITPLSAQNLTCNSIPSDSGLNANGNPHRFSTASEVHGTYDVFDLPAASRAVGDVSDDPAVFAAQEAATLESKAVSSRKVDSVVDLDVLRNPSPYRKILVSATHQPYEISEDGLQSGLALISAVYREAGKSEKSSDCSTLALSVEQQVKLNPSRVLEIVEQEVGANPGCSCEIVKAAIKFSEADVDQVVAIVEVGIHASPESMRIISQCAIAAMPESIAGVQALLAKLDPNAGETGYSSKSAKSGKDAKVAIIVAPPLPNPLDLPVGSPLTPLPVFPQEVTNVNPCGPEY